MFLLKAISLFLLRETISPEVRHEETYLHSHRSVSSIIISDKYTGPILFNEDIPTFLVYTAVSVCVGKIINVSERFGPNMSLGGESTT